MLESAADKLEEMGSDVVVFGSWVFDDVRKQERPAEWRLKVENLPANDPFNYTDIPDQIFNSFGNVVWNKLFRKSFVESHHLQFQEISRCNDTYFSTASLVLADKITHVNRLFVHYRTETKTSLQSTNDRDPRTMLAPYEKLLHLLKSKGIYETVQKSFLNWVLDCIVNIVDSFGTSRGFLDCRDAVLNQVEPTYALLDASPALFETTSNIKQYRALCTQEPLDYLLQRLAALRNERSNLNQIIAAQNETILCLEKQVSDVRRSASYRLGHALLEPARMLWKRER